MPKNPNKTKRLGQILICQQIPKFKIIKLFLIKFKIRIPQLISNILLKPRSLNQIRNRFSGHVKSDTISLSKNILSFMTKVNLNNGNETKLDIFPWDIFKSDSIAFFIEIY